MTKLQIGTCSCSPIQLRLNLSHEEVEKSLTEVVAHFTGGRRQVGIIEEEGPGTLVYAPDLRDDVYNAIVEAFSPFIVGQEVTLYPRAYANVPFGLFKSLLQEDGLEWDGLPDSLFEGLQIVPVTQIAWRGSTQNLERETSFYVLGDLPEFSSQIAKALLDRLEARRRITGQNDLPRVTLWCRYRWSEDQGTLKGTLVKQKAFVDRRV
jgi:hypothetical protein